MFAESAELYDLIYGEFKDYEAEVSQLAELIRELHPEAATVLDLGCGTGKHADLLTRSHGYEVDGVDIEPDFVAIANERCPDGAFTVGDMADFSLGTQYDVILSLFSAIGYVRTLERLSATARCIANHLKPDGVAVIEPWFTPETFTGGNVYLATVDKPELKIARTSHSEVKDGVSHLLFHYLVATPEGNRHMEEHHALGLFTTEEMTQALESGGLRIKRHDPNGLIERGMYIVGKESD